jgi:hypothetical protein
MSKVQGPETQVTVRQSKPGRSGFLPAVSHQFVVVPDAVEA